MLSYNKILSSTQQCANNSGKIGMKIFKNPIQVIFKSQKKDIQSIHVKEIRINS
jgi:hypothetical protein